jgi:predicted nucleotidyltransferase
VERVSTLGDVLRGLEPVVFAYLFGGLAAGPPNPLSDVDVALYVDRKANLEQARLDVLVRLTRHLATDELDLVVLNEAPIALVGRVLRTRKVIVDKEPFLRHRFESRCLREFFDFQQFEHRLLERRFARG